MSGALTREEIRSLLEGHGFVKLPRASTRARNREDKPHAEGWRLGSETVYLKEGNRLPLVIHPDREGELGALLAVAGVTRESKTGYVFNSNFAGFPKQKNLGQSETKYGLDFGFDSAAALHGFLAALGAISTSRSSGSPIAVKAGASQPARKLAAPAVRFDRDALALEAEFREPNNSRLMQWLPNYLATVSAVEQSCRSGEWATAFDLVWRKHDNSVSYAGQGILGKEAVDRHQDALMEMLQEIAADGSPEQFQQLVERFDRWYQGGTLPKVPRLLLARAFATVHPNRYHTTVAQTKHEAVIPWFEQHTGFVAPSGDWATRAAALTEHLERSGLFVGQQARRNMFPWYVFESLTSTPQATEFRPEHVSKVRRGQAATQEERRQVNYRQNVIQDRMVKHLRGIYGRNAVGSEQATGNDGKADVLVKLPHGRWGIYEIKPAESARMAVREAIGQLLEYGYRRGAYGDVSLHIVSDAPLDPVTEDYLDTLKQQFDLSFEYLQVSSDLEESTGEDR
jgi:hypothetical protein